MDKWAEAMKIFTFGFSSVFFVLGALAITVIITRVIVGKFAPNPKKK
ncbi:MAG: hypothetical protein J7J71_07270 [Deltaproteobacteria bacterium]|nr:hypothetical protein [Candidatus Tharpella sp.]